MKAVDNASLVMQNGNYVLNHKGEVWDISVNEMIYSSSYEDAKEFFINVTSD